MENSLNIRIAKSEDATAITTVMHDGFNEKFLAVLIYGCAGIDKYIKSLVNMPQKISDTTYVVAEIGEKIIGCVEFRYVGNNVFLNYISIASGYRNNGFGSKLLKKALRITSDRNADRMFLDVFEYNDLVRKWYNRLGFDIEYLNYWWIMDVPLVKRCLPGMVIGYTHSEACQKAYGFSNLTVQTTIGKHTVGRLENRWFRVSSIAALTDKELHVTLNKLDDTMRFLAILKEGALTADLEGSAAVYTRSTRMSIDMKKLWKVLK